MKRYRFLIQLAVVLAIFFAVRAYQMRDLAHGALPAIEAATLDGERVRLGEPGEPTVLHVWASWCGVCKAVEGSVQALSRDARVLTIAAQSGAATDVRRYMQRRGLNFPVINDPQGRLTNRLGVRAFPTTFFLGKDGEIRARDVGLATAWGMRARLWWAGW